MGRDIQFNGHNIFCLNTDITVELRSYEEFLLLNTDSF